MTDRTDRTPLASMSSVEFAAWCAYHQALLEDFCSFAQDYVLRRAARGTNIATDARYLHFLQEARDLIAGLAELRAEQVALQNIFICPDCQKEFEAVGYSNPIYWADTVANCPICGDKCWPKYKKLKSLKAAERSQEEG